LRYSKNFILFYSFLKKIFVFFANIWFRILFFRSPLYVRIGNSDPRIVVSLTSFPARINSVQYVLESIFRQTILPDRFILYLSSNQFNDISKIYDKFEKFSQRGLEIIFVDEDLGPHKKYFYAFQSFPNSKVITIDDDIIYARDFIEMFISETSECSVIANIGCDYCFEDDQAKFSEFRIPIGAGGIMYNIPQLNMSGLLEKKLISETSLFQDDLWLYFNNVKNNNSIFIRSNYKIIPIKSLSIFNSKFKLTDMNIDEGGNQSSYIKIKKILF